VGGMMVKVQAKQADRRFQSATEVAELLSRCLAHVQQPLVAPLPPNIPRTHTRVKGVTRRRRFGKAIAGLILVTVATLASRPWQLWQPVRSSTKPPAAAIPTPSPMRNAEQPRGATDDLTAEIGRTRARRQEFTADMYWRDDLPDGNSVFALAERVSAQVRSLERELASDRDTLDPRRKDRTILNSD